jgi:alkylation response protein AidB-like acyl-CoA dehydrogenase
MDARLTEEQQQIQSTARDFIESNGGIELARRRMAGDEAVVDELWRDLADLDFTAITVPLEHGGFGEGMVYLCALLEAAGRYALPGPLPETAAVAVPLVDELGTDDQRERYLPRIANGELRFSVAVYDDRHEEIPEAVQMDAERLEEGFRLSGTKTLVPYGGEVDRVLMAARTQDATGYQGISLFIVDPAEADVTQLESLDRTRPMYTLKFDDLVVDESALLGPLHGGGNALADAIDRYNVAFGAMLVGGADRAVELSTEYGNERTQYGQPIGRFQAVKHRIAEMWMAKEHARSIAYYAAWAINNDEPDARQAVSMMKAYAGSRLPELFADDVKNHGGMGFTWDHDTHIYLKQAKGWQNYFGSTSDHFDRVADVRDYSVRTLPDYPELRTAPYQ